MGIAYAADHWTEFGATAAEAAAALVGLLAVAISINLQRILQFPSLPHRAATTLIMFALPLVAGLLLVVPGQPVDALGWEFLAIGLTVGTYLLVTDVRVPRVEQETRYTWLISRIIPDVATCGCLVVAGATLLAGAGGGLYWLVPAMLAAIIFGLGNAWVLLVEILR